MAKYAELCFYFILLTFKSHSDPEQIDPAFYPEELDLNSILWIFRDCLVNVALAFISEEVSRFFNWNLFKYSQRNYKFILW